MPSNLHEQVEEILKSQYQPAADEGKITPDQAEKIAEEKAAVVSPILQERRDESDDSPVTETEVWQANMLALKQDLEEKIRPFQIDESNVQPGTPQAQALQVVKSVRSMTETLDQLSRLDPVRDREQIAELIQSSPLPDIEKGLGMESSPDQDGERGS
jgi:hypothetical protein